MVFGAAVAAAAGLPPDFLDTVAIVFFPVGCLGAFAVELGLDETFFLLAGLADFTVFLDDGFDGAFAVFRAGFFGRLAADFKPAFLATFFLLAGAFFLVAAFFAAIA